LIIATPYVGKQQGRVTALTVFPMVGPLIPTRL
jgi:hypothetical protein